MLKSIRHVDYSLKLIILHRQFVIGRICQGAPVNRTGLRMHQDRYLTLRGLRMYCI